MGKLMELPAYRIRSQGLLLFARIELREIPSAWWASAWALEALLQAELREPGTLANVLPVDVYRRLSASGSLAIPLTREALSQLRKLRGAIELEEAAALEAAADSNRRALSAHEDLFR